MNGRRGTWSLLGVVAILLASCTSSPKTPEEITVAAYDFPENVMVAEVYALVLQNAGIRVQRSYDYTSREAQFSDGTVDIVPEYLGSLTETVNVAVNGQDAAPVASGDPEATTDALRELLEPYQVVVADPAQAQSQLGFAVRASFATEHNLANLSDLAALNGQLIFGGPPGCETYQFCLKGLQEDYGLQFKQFVPLDTGGADTLNSLEAGVIDVGMVFLSDPAVDARDFVILKDDKQLEVAGNITPVLASSAASQDVMDLVAQVGQQLTTDELRAMNARVSIEGYPADWVAARWAADKGLVAQELVPPSPQPTPPPSPTPPPPPPPPAPEPKAEAPKAPAPPAGGGGYARNMGSPSAKAVARNWPALAQCESGGNPRIVSSNGLYHGLYQFSVPTWRSMGGSGAASSASADEQTYRAQILYDRAGPGQWPHCGKRL